MIDLITLMDTTLTDSDVTALVTHNDLQTNSKDGVVYYDNMSTKNFTRQKGVFIRVETNQKLKVECSLHKYNNETSGLDRNNYNLFTMSQAKDSIDRLIAEKALPRSGLRVYNYEIGLNLNVSKDCRFYLDKMKTIGAAGSEKPFFVDPAYIKSRAADPRIKVTGLHRHVRKYFKVYDKIYESMDKKRKVIPDGNILRIETVYRRLDNCHVTDFFARDNLYKMVEAFFRDWRTLQFDQDIITPKGTGRARQQLCIDLIDKGREAVLQRAKERHRTGALKDWEYRNIREFVANEWDTVKNGITFIHSDEETEFRHLMHINHAILRNE